MLVKKYEARDMQQAMDSIVKELGSEAVILNSRKLKKKGLASLFQKPMIEVMVAYEPKKPQNGKKPHPALQQTARGAYSPFALNAHSSANNANSIVSGAVYSDDPLVPLPEPPRAAPAVPLPPQPAPAMPPVAAAPPTATPATPSQLSEIDSRISSLDQVLSDFMHKFSYIKRDVTYNFSPEVEELLLALNNNEVREELALSLAKETEEILKTRTDARAYDVMHHLICEQLGSPAPINLKKYKQKVILFLGPTGVGKTTSLVKLASTFAINHKKKVGIINTDTYRIAAHEQLRTYADILDIPLGIAYRMEDLGDTLAQMQDCDIVFVDTAGKRPGDSQHKEDIDQIIAFTKPEDTFLCVSAPTGFSAMREIADTYSFVGDYKLLITKVDETKCRGMVLNIANYTKKPLSYVTTGQNVPDDLEAADTELLAKQLLER